jgi:gas vesicle protein
MGKYGSFLVGAILGGIIGGVVALIFAPASGDTTRDHIVSYSKKVTDDVRTAARQKRIELENELANLRKPQTISLPEED